MYTLPNSIIIDDTEYAIRNNGDYRTILDCFSALEDIELPQQYRIYSALIIFYDGINSVDDVENKLGENVEEAVNKMFDFFNCGQENVGMQVNYKLIDWEQDSQIISAAINNVARREIRSEPYLHWWTFMGYYCSIGESILSTVVNIRDKIVKSKKLEKHEKEFKRNNPQYFNWRAEDIQKQEDDKLAFSMWNAE